MTADWGPWHLDGNQRLLFVTDPYRYEVDLDDCHTSAQVLDWICQVAGKTWADDAILAGLVRAIDDVLYPAENLCSGGRAKSIDRHRMDILIAHAKAARLQK